MTLYSTVSPDAATPDESNDGAGSAASRVGRPGTVVGAHPAGPGSAAGLGEPAADPGRLVRYWNDVLLDVFRAVGGPPGPLARTAAMLHGAIFDVVNNQLCVDRRLDSLPYRSYLGVLPTEPAASAPDAINVAARDLLLSLHPSCEPIVAAAFEAAYRGRAHRVTSRLGQAAARAMLRVRAGDGAHEVSHHHPTGERPGAWRPTEPGVFAAAPHWGRVTPFSFGSASTFRPPLPARLSGYPDLLTSFVYAQQVNEVKALGAAEGAARGAEQTEIAWFWAHDLDGTVKVPGHLLQVTAGLAPEGSLLADARLFALVSFALADAAVAAWDSKYEAPVSLWRPETAIRLAGQDGNPVTEPAPRWRPLSADRRRHSFTPASPSYVCSHAALAGAWAAVLRDYFGTDRRPFTAGTEDPHLPAGTTRGYASFSEAAAESARSRVYLGVHFDFDTECGLDLGGAVGRHVVRTQFYRR